MLPANDPTCHVVHYTKRDAFFFIFSCLCLLVEQVYFTVTIDYAFWFIVCSLNLQINQPRGRSSQDSRLNDVTTHKVEAMKMPSTLLKL